MKTQQRSLVSTLLLATGLSAAVCGQSALDGFDPNANGAVRVVVLQPDGKILIGGDFTSVTNGGVSVTRNHIARLDPATGLADLFDPNANTLVFSIAVQADGRILAGGNFTSIGGQTRTNMARRSTLNLDSTSKIL